MKQLPPSFKFEPVSDIRAAARRVRDHLESYRMSCKLGAPLDKLLAKSGWIVGSHVWMPALDLNPDITSDVDLVFSNSINKDTAVAMLKNTGLFDMSTNAFGSDRFVYKGSTTVAADVWVLPPDQSIVEHVMTFSQRHEHMAFAVGLPVDMALTRLTHHHYTSAGQPQQKVTNAPGKNGTASTANGIFGPAQQSPAPYQSRKTSVALPSPFTPQQQAPAPYQKRKQP